MSSKDLWVGVGAGACAALAAPFVWPVVRAVARPLLREAFKLGFIAAEFARVRSAEALEALEDLLAEAREDARNALEPRDQERGAPREDEAPPPRRNGGGRRAAAERA